jgi:hypothetical protein
VIQCPAYLRWPVFRCPSLAGFGCPPRNSTTSRLRPTLQQWPGPSGSPAAPASLLIPRSHPVLLEPLRFATSCPRQSGPLYNEWIEARDEKRVLRYRSIWPGGVVGLGFAPLSKTGAEMLFEVFSQRYERTSTRVTSNQPSTEWTEVMGSERLTGAAGSTDPPCAHRGNERVELSAQGQQEEERSRSPTARNPAGGRRRLTLEAVGAPTSTRRSSRTLKSERNGLPSMQVVPVFAAPMGTSHSALDTVSTR